MYSLVNPRPMNIKLGHADGAGEREARICYDPVVCAGQLTKLESRRRRRPRICPTRKNTAGEIRPCARSRQSMPQALAHNPRTPRLSSACENVKFTSIRKQASRLAALKLCRLADAAAVIKGPKMAHACDRPRRHMNSRSQAPVGALAREPEPFRRGSER